MAERRAEAAAQYWGLGTILRVGIVGGLIAGIVFVIFEMAAAAAMGMPALMPARMIAGIALGPAAMDPAAVDAVTAVAVAMAIHLPLSILFGVIFVAVLTGLVSIFGGWLVLAGLIYGLALWLANFYVIAPLGGWTWFPQETNPVVQFLAHAIFFGAVLGWYVSRQRRREQMVA